MSLPQAQLDEVHRVFGDYLKMGGQRRTPERFAILDELYSTAGHHDADELYLRLKEKKIRVSRATVYNTLELLLDCDLVVKHQFGRAQAKYERAYAYWQHDHLICLDCEEVLEFCDPRIQTVKDTVAEIYGFAITQHALHLHGHCRRESCPNRAAKKAAA